MRTLPPSKRINLNLGGIAGPTNGVGLREVPASMLAAAVPLQLVHANDVGLIVGHMCILNLPKNEGRFPAVITRIYPEGTLVDSHDEYDEDGSRKKVPWAGEYPIIAVKGFRPFKPDAGMKRPKDGWPEVDELVASPVPYRGDVLKQAKDAGYPESMVDMVMNYLIVKEITSY